MPISLRSQVAAGGDVTVRRAGGRGVLTLRNGKVVPNRVSEAASIGLLFGLIAVVDYFTWAHDKLGGFSLEGPTLFNLHPLLMLLSMLCLAAVGVLTYRMDPLSMDPDGTNKHANKTVHSGLMTASLALGGAGVYCAAAGGEESMDSFHSWVGVATMTAFAANALLGVLKFVYVGRKGEEEGDKEAARRSSNIDEEGIIDRCLGSDLLPRHRVLGVVAVAIAYLAAASGVYKLGDCGSDGGCKAGTSLFFLVVLMGICVIAALHPELLHPENLCIDSVESVLCSVESTMDRNSNDEGDARDNMLGGHVRSYDYDTDGGADADIGVYSEDSWSDDETPRSPMLSSRTYDSSSSKRSEPSSSKKSKKEKKEKKRNREENYGSI